MRDAKSLTLALGGRWHGSQGMALCPAHDDGKTPALSIRQGDKRAVILRCHAGCETRDVIAELQRRGLWPSSDRPLPPAVQRERREQEQNRELAARGAVVALWRRAGPIAGSPAERYLRGRGIVIPLPGTLRYLMLRHPGTGLALPCMIAAATDAARQLIALHRTWLTLSGEAKAPLASPRMLLGSPGAGAIRLAAPEPTLGLAEGIESALSAQALFRVPCWSAISAARLHAIDLPAEVQRVILFADNDPAGMEAAEKAAAHYRRLGRAVAIKAPDAEGQDWNDVLQARRAAA